MIADRVAEVTFAPDHPAGPGHFPGNPVIPGAVLLAAVFDSLEGLDGTSLCRCVVKSAKFFSPARPGDRMAIGFAALAGNALKFECQVAERVVLAGTLARISHKGTR
jgi:3-hydroxyacyl-[acyl-carrier-protein] dehydratase